MWNALAGENALSEQGARNAQAQRGFRQGAWILLASTLSCPVLALGQDDAKPSEGTDPAHYAKTVQETKKLAEKYLQADPVGRTGTLEPFQSKFLMNGFPEVGFFKVSFKEKPLKQEPRSKELDIPAEPPDRAGVSEEPTPAPGAGDEPKPKKPHMPWEKQNVLAVAKGKVYRASMPVDLARVMIEAGKGVSTGQMFEDAVSGWLELAVYLEGERGKGLKPFRVTVEDWSESTVIGSGVANAMTKDPKTGKVIETADKRSIVIETAWTDGLMDSVAVYRNFPKPKEE